MAETQSIAPIGTDVSELGGSSVFEHDRVVAQHDGIHEASVGSSLVISRDPRFVGTGFFAGEAPDGLTTVYGDPIPADVFVYWRDQDNPLEKEVLVGAAKSAQDGTWRIMGLNYNLQYVIRARAQGYNDTTVVGAMPSRADVIAYVDQLVPREDEFGDVDRLTGHVFLDSGLPPFTCEVIEPLPYGLTARVDGRKLLIEGVSTDNGLWDSVVRVTASNGVWVDVPVQVQIQVLHLDPHWDKVVALLHFDGSAGSTLFGDETGRLWVAEGSARISTGNKVFGSGSGRFDGISNARIRSPASPDFFLGTEDFCIEARVYISWSSALSSGGARHSAIFAVARPQGASLEFLILGDSIKTGTGLALWNGATLISVPGEIAHGEWHYLAVTRYGSVFRFWLNGSQLGSDQTSSITFGSATVDAFIGGSVVHGYNYLLNGYIDELRITKGVGRYTENFTPPDKPFPSR